MLVCVFVCESLQALFWMAESQRKVPSIRASGLWFLPPGARLPGIERVSSGPVSGHTWYFHVFATLQSSANMKPKLKTVSMQSVDNSIRVYRHKETNQL